MLKVIDRDATLALLVYTLAVFFMGATVGIIVGVLL